jgi:hypothetical protein
MDSLCPSGVTCLDCDWLLWICKDCDDGGRRYQFQHQPKPLCHCLAATQRHAGDIAAGPVEARDNAERHGIAADDKDNGNSRSGCFGGADRRSASGGDNYRYPSADEVGRKGGQPIILTVCVAVFERHIPAF